ncbi:hypothetical protein F4810DRAFT_715607 [Camillea tinctor]|nr:hypothetical protein F4810DRAFT_715607 [Camillea tinctor]
MVGPTRYTDEQINFILDRTVRDVPRGETVNLHRAVARDFREAYKQPDFGLNQVRYVTERYGSDPDYGNRWGKLVRPVASATPPTPQDTGVPVRETPGARRLARKSKGGGMFALCAHCGGSGVQKLLRDPPPRPDTSYRHFKQGPSSQEPLEIPTSNLRDTYITSSGDRNQGPLLDDTLPPMRTTAYHGAKRRRSASPPVEALWTLLQQQEELMMHGGRSPGPSGADGRAGVGEFPGNEDDGGGGDGNVPGTKRIRLMDR